MLINLKPFDDEVTVGVPVMYIPRAQSSMLIRP